MAGRSLRQQRGNGPLRSTRNRLRPALCQLTSASGRPTVQPHESHGGRRSPIADSSSIRSPNPSCEFQPPTHRSCRRVFMPSFRIAISTAHSRCVSPSCSAFNRRKRSSLSLCYADDGVQFVRLLSVLASPSVVVRHLTSFVPCQPALRVCLNSCPRADGSFSAAR